eukprot:497627-Amphidinium_carterae.1
MAFGLRAAKLRLIRPSMEIKAPKMKAKRQLERLSSKAFVRPGLSGNVYKSVLCGTEVLWSQLGHEEGKPYDAAFVCEQLSSWASSKILIEGHSAVIPHKWSWTP